MYAKTKETVRTTIGRDQGLQKVPNMIERIDKKVLSIHEDLQQLEETYIKEVTEAKEEIYAQVGKALGVEMPHQRTNIIDRAHMIKENVKERFEGTVEDIKELGCKVGDKFCDAKDYVVDKFEDQYDNLRTQGKKIINKAGEGLNKGLNKAGEGLNKAGEKLKTGFETIKDKSEDLLEDAQDKLHDAKYAVKDRFHEEVWKVEQGLHDAKKGLKHAAHDIKAEFDKFGNRIFHPEDTAPEGLKRMAYYDARQSDDQFYNQQQRAPQQRPLSKEKIYNFKTASDINDRASSKYEMNSDWKNVYAEPKEQVMYRPSYSEKDVDHSLSTQKPQVHHNVPVEATFEQMALAAFLMILIIVGVSRYVYGRRKRQLIQILGKEFEKQSGVKQFDISKEEAPIFQMNPEDATFAKSQSKSNSQLFDSLASILEENPSIVSFRQFLLQNYVYSIDNVRNEQDQTLLVYFAQRNQPQIVRFLIQNFGDTINVQHRDVFGKTAFDYAQENSNLELIGCLNSFTNSISRMTMQETSFEGPTITKTTTLKVGIEEKSMINCDDFSYE